MRFNINKTKIVHFRDTSEDRSIYEFMYGTNILDIVDKYKYLGVILDEQILYLFLHRFWFIGSRKCASEE